MQVLPEALALADQITSTTSPLAMQETLHLTRISQLPTIKEQLVKEAAAQARCFAGPDYRIALESVKTKTPPVFE